MMTQKNRVWVAYGAAGAIGSIKEIDGGAFEVQLAGKDDPVGTYPELEIAKRALHARMRPGADRPDFHRH
jgi:hypothetical protein